MCVLIFPTTLFEKFLILRLIQRNIIIICMGIRVQYRYSCQILMNFEFWQRIFKVSLAAELFHTDGRTDGWTHRQTDRQTDMAKVIVAFRNFANSPRKDGIVLV